VALCVERWCQKNREGTDAEQEWEPRAKAALDHRKPSGWPIGRAHHRSGRRRRILAGFQLRGGSETFLRLSGDGGKTGWWSREATSGELVSVLLAPCAEVKQVALDPLPLSLGGAMVPFVSVKRDRFVQYLIGERRGVAGELVPG